MKRPKKNDYSKRTTSFIFSQKYEDDLNKYIDFLETKSDNDLLGDVSIPVIKCPECLQTTTQAELDMFGGLCEECSGAFDE